MSESSARIDDELIWDIEDEIADERNSYDNYGTIVNPTGAGERLPPDNDACEGGQDEETLPTDTADVRPSKSEPAGGTDPAPGGYRAPQGTARTPDPAGPQSGYREIVLDHDGRARQAGADKMGKEGQFIEDFRKVCERNLFVFAKGVLGRHFLTAELHKPVCEFIQTCPPARKLVLMPREHAKCWSRDYALQELRKTPLSFASWVEYSDTKFIKEDVGEIRPILRVTTEYGKELEVTDNHPFFIWSEHEHHVWRRADELTDRCWLVVPRKLPFFNIHKPGLAALFGYMIGDGDCAKMQFHQWDGRTRRRFAWLVRVCGGTPEIRETSVLARGVRKLFRAEGLENSRSAHKFVPKFVLDGDEKTVRAFLNALFVCDATTTGGRDYGTKYTTTSKQLAREVQHLLLKFGIKARLYKAKTKLHGVHYWSYKVVFLDDVGIWKKQRGQKYRYDLLPPFWRKNIPAGWKGKLRRAGIRVDNKYSTSRDKVSRVANFVGSSYLQSICDSQFAWERVKKIERLEPKAIVSVESRPYGNMLFGDVVTHNTAIISGALPPHIHIQPAESNIYFPGLAGSECRLLLSGETETMAKKNLRVVKSIYTDNQLLAALWPESVWEGGEKAARGAAKEWSSNAIILPRQNEWPDPSIRAVGVGGAITGARPNVLIKDDLVSFAAANSEVVMQEAIDWHIASRALLETYEVESGRSSLEFIIGTRWAVHDLYSYIIENDPSVEVIDEHFWRIIDDGKILWPEKHTEKTIEQLRSEHGAAFFLLYMNTAADSSLTDFDVEQIRRYKLIEDKIIFDLDERDTFMRERKERIRDFEGSHEPAAPAPQLRGLRLQEGLDILARRQEYFRLSRA